MEIIEKKLISIFVDNLFEKYLACSAGRMDDRTAFIADVFKSLLF